MNEPENQFDEKIKRRREVQRAYYLRNRQLKIDQANNRQKELRAIAGMKPRGRPKKGVEVSDEKAEE